MKLTKKWKKENLKENNLEQLENLPHTERKSYKKISENNIEGREEKKKMKKRKKLQTYEKILIWSGLTKKKSLMKSLSPTIPNKERKSL